MKLLTLSVVALLTFTSAIISFAGDGEYVGEFKSETIPNKEKIERIILKPITNIQDGLSFGQGSHVTGGRLLNLASDKFSIRSLLVEEIGQSPTIFVDLNDDSRFSDEEKFQMRKENGSPYLWNVTVSIPMRDKKFNAFPLFIRYFKSVTTEKMTKADRLITQTGGVFAQGIVDINGKKVLVQYEYNVADNKLETSQGWLGFDTDGNGEVDMDSLSPEAGKSGGEPVIFRVGQNYLSTKKADLAKNQITIREHKSTDYKRFELAVGKEILDFKFEDFDGKKRKLSDFRGKFVLLDIWGLWCPACLEELPYLRESFRRYQSRNLEIIGLNTDENFAPEQIKDAMKKIGMTWTQAKFESIFDLLKTQLRISSFPTTMLISPEGKILSMSRQERDELDLRGRELLDTLDEILPQ